ncbi:Acetyltransferase (isoleucine patch superfamily) [Litoreibacter ascidiaceicola]|uniref:Chloramphenicol acetyltransferase n=1 Tax=Litoreibacter ascidiaceicola TaxID=1486859 RepID=A0A1M4TEX5_9RHOB|nr:CatB-related O-acetyltransferase [Litoreibacter ascidiaceicola]SHE42894.1 Acetyltransferase (isoleucine patch superfamily) [Litoreibacter ascidiaceicola]
MAPKLNKNLSYLKKIGLRVAPGFNTRGRSLNLAFETPSQLNNGPAFYYNDLQIGAYSYLRTGTVRHVRRIGRYCSIAPNVTLGESEHMTNWLSSSTAFHRADQFSFYPPEKEAAAARVLPMDAAPHDAATGDVDIGHDVWIGTNVTVRRGVTIGTGAVIGGGAFVVKDVPPYAIVAGVPAKILRYRFPDKVIEAMHLVRWWEFDANDLAELPFNQPLITLLKIAEQEAAGTIARRPEDFGQIHLTTKGFHVLQSPASPPTPT